MRNKFSNTTLAQRSALREIEELSIEYAGLEAKKHALEQVGIESGRVQTIFL